MVLVVRVLIFIVLASVTACYQSSIENTNSALTTPKPRSLARIDNSILSAKITINGSQEHNGRLLDNGTWVVSLPSIELGQDHTITVNWYAESDNTLYLLVRQQGMFHANPTTLQATVNLPSISSGSAEFDSDCDSTTNLDEIKLSTDLNSLPGCGSDPSTIPVATMSPVTFEFPYDGQILDHGGIYITRTNTVAGASRYYTRMSQTIIEPSGVTKSVEETKDGQQFSLGPDEIKHGQFQHNQSTTLQTWAVVDGVDLPSNSISIEHPKMVFRSRRQNIPATRRTNRRCRR